MLDFLTVATRSTKRDGTSVIEVYPKFKICKSKDLMIRGGDFYAVFNEDTGLWSTEEDTLNQLVDIEVKRHGQKLKSSILKIKSLLHTWWTRIPVQSTDGISIVRSSAGTTSMPLTITFASRTQRRSVRTMHHMSCLIH